MAVSCHGLRTPTRTPSPRARPPRHDANPFGLAAATAGDDPQIVPAHGHASTAPPRHGNPTPACDAYTATGSSYAHARPPRRSGSGGTVCSRYYRTTGRADITQPRGLGWSSDAPLQPGQVFEVAFWLPGQGPEDGLGWTEATIGNSVSAKLFEQPPGTYYWGVWLGTYIDGAYQRLRYLGGGYPLEVTREPAPDDTPIPGTGGGGGGDDGGGGEPPPADTPDPGGKAHRRTLQAVAISLNTVCGDEDRRRVACAVAPCPCSSLPLDRFRKGDVQNDHYCAWYSSLGDPRPLSAGAGDSRSLEHARLGAGTLGAATQIQSCGPLGPLTKRIL